MEKFEDNEGLLRIMKKEKHDLQDLNIYYAFNFSNILRFQEKKWKKENDDEDDSFWKT